MLTAKSHLWKFYDGVPRKLVGSARWSRHRKDGVPRKLVAQ